MCRGSFFVHSELSADIDAALPYRSLCGLRGFGKAAQKAGMALVTSARALSKSSFSSKPFLHCTSTTEVGRFVHAAAPRSCLDGT